jgi:pantoate--beta-alanine ligase
VSTVIDVPTVLETIAAYSEALDAVRARGATVGLVPTMGALHEGHLSLIERAARECDVCAVTIFVNPTQFGDPSDLDHYPRTLEADIAALSAAGGQLVFAPSVDEMYPEGSEGAEGSEGVAAPELTKRWEGAARPGHFDGVATIVVKLLAGAGPCRAYFGEKDFQQLALIRRVVADHRLPTEVVGGPTVRDRDGLALSSRNLRLSAEQRKSATVLFRALTAGAAVIAAGEERPAVVDTVMAETVAAVPGVTLDYAAVVDADDLEPAVSCATNRSLRLLIAAEVGSVRLIDNLDPRAPGAQARA